jgi:hypothetical protein
VKRFAIALLVSASLLASSPGASVARAAEAPAAAPRILLDGLPLGFLVPPRVEDDRTMVPFRVIAEALGVAVTWHEDSRSIDAGGLGRSVRLAIDNKTMWVDGVPVLLDVPPMIVDGSTLVPLRAFSTAFGAQVGWEQATQTAAVLSPVREMRTLAFYALRSYPERQFVSRFSDAAYGWSMLTADGHVDLKGGEYRWPEPDGDITGERLLADAATARVRRHLMIHAVDGTTADLAGLVRNPDTVARAAREIAAVTVAKGFDGVVLDLESLGQNETGDDLKRVRDGFTSFVATVTKGLHAANKEVIVSVHPLNGWYHGYDYAALADSADLLEVMAHDYVQDGSPDPADKVEEAIRLAVQHVGADRRAKLLLGIVSAYETPETLKQKVGLAKRYSLAGISLWRLGEIQPERMQALDSTVAPKK